ncbi:M24 family metallopeptidase [Rhodovibrionaceae bacterium A322]
MAFLSKAVFDSRLVEMKALMAREGLDGLLVSNGDFFQFITNFHLDVQTWERPVMLVLTKEGELFALMNELSTHHLKMAGERGVLWLDDVTLYDEHRGGLNSERLLPDWTRIAADLLTARGLANATLGTDGSGGPIARLPQELPGLTLRPIVSELRKLRRVKHPEELTLMRQAADLSDWAQERYRENIRPGRIVQELDAAMTALMFEEAAHRFPDEYLEIRVYSLTGPTSASPHGNGAPTGIRVAEGDGLVNIIIPRLNGLVIENERTYFAGQPSDKQIHLYETALDANKAAIDEMVTGRPVSGIEDAARGRIVQAGYGDNIRHRTGHGIGYLGHEWPADMPFNDRPLEANEVYSAEPGIYVYGIGGFRIDDTVVIGDQPEVLTKAPKDLDSIILPV